MLQGSFSDLEKLDTIQDELKNIKNYLQKIESFSVKQDILDQNITVNFVEYSTKDRDKAIWEAHKVNIDFQYIYSGTECMDLAPKNLLVSESYNEEEDIYFLKGKEENTVRLDKGDFILLFPDTPHRGGIHVDAPTPVQKIVFKIRK